MYVFKKVVLLILTILPTYQAFSCFEAKQLKIFPIGIYEGSLISIDVEIIRTEPAAFHDDNIPDDVYYIAWVLKSRISVYDLEQRLLSTVQKDSVVVFKPTYVDELKELYINRRNEILKNYKTIDLLKPKKLTFYKLWYFDGSTNMPQHQTVRYDSIAREYTIIHQKKKYPLPILKDSTHFFFIPDDLSEHLNTLPYATIPSSASAYRSNSYELTIIHLQGGMGMGMSLIENRKKYEEAFSNPQSFPPVYEEVIFPHAFGVDVFLVRKIKTE